MRNFYIWRWTLNKQKHFKRANRGAFWQHSSRTTEVGRVWNGKFNHTTQKEDQACIENQFTRSWSHDSHMTRLREWAVHLLKKNNNKVEKEREAGRPARSEVTPLWQPTGGCNFLWHHRGPDKVRTIKSMAACSYGSIGTREGNTTTTTHWSWPQKYMYVHTRRTRNRIPPKPLYTKRLCCAPTFASK